MNAYTAFCLGVTIYTRRESSFKIHPENMVIVIQCILKIFTMHFSKINQTYFIFYFSFINECEKFTLNSSKYNIVPEIPYFRDKF